MKGSTIQSSLSRSFVDYKSNVAIEGDGKNITYQALDAVSSWVAESLVNSGCKKGSIVGIHINNIEDVIISIIAVLKARGIFVPIDVNTPLKGIGQLVSNVDFDFIITDNQNFSNELKTSSPIIDINEINASYPKTNNYHPNLVEEYDEEDPIYLFFTSGSTGTPNGVLGKNKSVRQFIEWEIKEFNLKSPRVSQFITPGFDAILRDIFVPLFSGGTICLLPEREMLKDPFMLRKWINQKQINLIHCVPSILAMLIEIELKKEDFPFLKYVLLSGERIKPKLLQKWYDLFKDRIELVNFYGATETTMIKTFYRIQPIDVRLERIPVGKPIDGARALVLDEQMNVCPDEIVGELYIRTPYSTYGYYKNPSLTATKFIPNPFSNNPNDIIYKTGDLCKIKVDGNIDFIGRADRQVKIRGIRVELFDIESKILQYPGVKEAVVQKLEELNGSLVAFITLEEQKKVDEENLKKFLLEILSENLFPTEFVFLSSLPRNVNGKIAYDQFQSLLEKKKSFEPTTELQKKIFAIWEEVLKNKNFDSKTSFFMAGGHSLNALLLIHKLHKELKVKIPANKIFEVDTIEKQEMFISQEKPSLVQSINPANEKSYYKASSAQKRWYIYHQINTNNTAYNLSFAVKISGKLEVEKLKGAVVNLIAKHEILRTSFHVIDNEVVQKIHTKGNLRFQVINQENSFFNTQQLKNYTSAFDLAQPTQLAVILLKYGEEEYTLVLNSHHIISDGFSQILMLRYLINSYKGIADSLPDIQYKDFSEWQSTDEFKNKINCQKKYWTQNLPKTLNLLELPYDFVHKSEANVKASSKNFKLDEDSQKKIHLLGAEHRTTPNILLFTLYSVFLSRLCNQSDVIVGTPVLGRTHPDLQTMLGSFINMIVLYTAIDGSKSFMDLVNQNAKIYSGALENQDFTFDELIKCLSFERTEGRNPLVDVAFVYKDFEVGDLKVNTLSIEPVSEKSETKFDLSLFVDKGKDSLYFSFVYASHLFREETIALFVEFFQAIAQKLLADPTMPINQVGFEEGLASVHEYEYLMSDNLENE